MSEVDDAINDLRILRTHGLDGWSKPHLSQWVRHVLPCIDAALRKIDVQAECLEGRGRQVDEHLLERTRLHARILELEQAIAGFAARSSHSSDCAVHRKSGAWPCDCPFTALVEALMKVSDP